MKTKTTQTTKIGENTNTRNLFQKTFILLAILTLSSICSSAQTMHFTVNNSASTGCDWTVRVLDGSNIDIITPYTSTGGSGVVLVASCVTGVPNEVRVTRGLCTVSFYAPFTFTTYAPPCTGSCSASIDCAGSNPSICGGGANDWAIILQIQ